MRKSTSIIALLLSTLLTQAQDDLTSGGLLQQNNQLLDMLENGESGVLTLDPGMTFDPSNPSDPGDPIGLNGPGDGGDGEGLVPIDGGLSLLLAAGAAYGARRLRKGARERKSKGA
jgi:hypothetical protein